MVVVVVAVIKHYQSHAARLTSSPGDFRCQSVVRDVLVNLAHPEGYSGTVENYRVPHGKQAEGIDSGGGGSVVPNRRVLQSLSARNEICKRQTHSSSSSSWVHDGSHR